MRRVAIPLSFGLLCGLSIGPSIGCAPRPRTQVTIIVEAETTVARDAIRLDTRIEGGTTDWVERNIESTGTFGMPVQFPVHAALIPLGGDATRRFRFAATAFDAMGQELGTVRALSSFSRGQTATIRLVLEDCCRTARCTEDQTCRNCMCEQALITPISEGDAGVDAGALREDASSNTPDAFSVDAFSATTPDAGRMVTSGIDVMADTAGGGAGGALFFSCRRPAAGACPSAVGPETLPCGIWRVRNARPTPINVTFSTGGTADTFLALYRDDTVDLYSAPSAPADPGACTHALDNTAGFEPHERVTVEIPPGAIYTATYSRVVATDPGTISVDARVL